MAKEPKVKVIKETKVTCNSCGAVSYYGKEDQLQELGKSMQNLGKGVSCCTGCGPALLLKDHEVTDFRKCPQCKSRNISKEVVTHEVK